MCGGTVLYAYALQAALSLQTLHRHHQTRGMLSTAKQVCKATSISHMCWKPRSRLPSPARARLDGRGEAGGEHIGRQVRVLRQHLPGAAGCQQDALTARVLALAHAARARAVRLLYVGPAAVGKEGSLACRASHVGKANNLTAVRGAGLGQGISSLGCGITRGTTHAVFQWCLGPRVRV